MLYQLSYSRLKADFLTVREEISSQKMACMMLRSKQWGEQDSNL